MKMDCDKEFKVYRRRWLVLILYVLFCMANALQWIQYAIIADVIIKYYNVEYSAVNWTSLIYMLVYIVLIFPATWLYNKIGIRWALILGSIGNFLGAWIKVLSVSPDLFWVTFIGQTVAAMAQVYVMSTPADVAATWFGPAEVSTACAIGVFGMQFGNTLGVLIPPIMVKDGSIEEIGNDLWIMFFSIAIFTTVLLVLTVIFLQAAPPTPPSAAQANRSGLQSESPRQFGATVVRVLKNPNYSLLNVSYGINVGVFCTFMTFLNQMILIYYPQGQSDAGNIGVTLMVFGVTGAILLGYFLDYTRKYKETCLVLYTLATLALAAYTLLLGAGPMTYLYITGAIIGFAMISYLPSGYEFGAELTYPEAESTTSCVLAICTQVFALIFTLVYGAVLPLHGAATANWILCGALMLGTVLSLIIKSDLRRQKAEIEAKATQQSTSSYRL